MTTSSPRIHAYFDDGRPFRSRFFSGCTDSVTLPTFPSYFFLLLSNWFFFLFPYLRLRGKVFFSPVTEFCCCGTTYLFRKKKNYGVFVQKERRAFFRKWVAAAAGVFPDARTSFNVLFVLLYASTVHSGYSHRPSPRPISKCA